MILLVRLLKESGIFALQAIIANRLRTLLSLLGITIGIFAVITVFTVVDSMENTVKTSIESLGNNVLFIQKWPWTFGKNYPWWKYINRPVPKYEEMQEVQKRATGAASVSFMISANRTVKHNDNSMDNTTILCIAENYEKIMSFDINVGRYFTPLELHGGKPVAIIGYNVYYELFNSSYPLGKEIKIFGRDHKVVGVFKKQGDDAFGNSNDNQVVIPVNSARNLLDIDSEAFNPMILVSAAPGVSNEELKAELTGIMRSVRKIRPIDEDNFSINETSLLSNAFQSLFDMLTVAGWIIGGFSLLVGGFGIANIMFVSVHERTHIIGIQKSLGAKNYFILFQFLFEAIILCLFGGIAGLLIVYFCSIAAASAFDMSLTLSYSNILLGLIVSLVIGVISGFIPSFLASRMNPVNAIRFSAT